MRTHIFKKGRACLNFILFLLLLPAISCAQAGKGGPPYLPIAQPLVREGTLAVDLLHGFGLGVSRDEIAGERRLGEVGIAPENGWIADYPLTPDILWELRQAIAIAVKSGRIPLDEEEAEKRFRLLCAGYGISVPQARRNADDGRLSPRGDVAALENIYSVMGPPVMTFVVPPPSYLHLYHNVRFPFRINGHDFPGYYILKRFHRTLFVDGRVAFVTNQFHVFKNHRMFLIDPVERLKGKSYAGIGAPAGGKFIDTGIGESRTRLFNGPQPWVRSMPVTFGGE